MAENNDKFIDFDEYFEEQEAEQKEEQLSFKFSGKTYHLPSSMPAILPVKIMRLKKKYGKEKNIPDDEMYSLMLNLLDEDELEEIASKATSDQLNKILIWIMNQYKSSAQKDKEKGGKTKSSGKKSK